MEIEFRCPKCGKRFTVKDEAGGKRGKCPCGAVINIPSMKVSASELSENDTPKKDRAGRDTSTVTAEMQRPISAVESTQPKGTPLTEEWVRKSLYARLTGFSIGVLIVTVFLFFEYGQVAAIIGFIVGVVFTITSCKHLLSYDRKLVKNKVKYEEQKAKLRIPKKPQTVAASTAFLLAAFVGLFFVWDKYYNQEKCWGLFGNFLFENMGVKAILLIVNIPVFVFIGKWMGGWKFPWQLFKFDLKSRFLPFFIFTKKHWEFYEESVDYEKLLQASAIPVVCLAVYLVEYIIIKLLFLI